jgi:predicted neuraminidase
VLEEFIAALPPTPQSHASTLVETRNGTLLAAWFGGEHEGAADVGIWLTRREVEGWQPPRRVAGGVQDDVMQDDAAQDEVMRHESSPQPAWNPVLFQPAHGPLQLFYKVGPNPRQWWGMLTVSNDDGLSWSAPRRLPDGILGPIKNKPLQVPSGRILAPSSSEDEADGWRVHIETSDDDGLHWRRGEALNDPAHIGAIQPSLLRHRDGRLQALGRSKQNRVFSAFSSDDGETWGPMTLLDVENPNAGTDAVMLHDGRALLVYNSALAGEDWWDGRGVLAVALSNDGVHWRRVLTLEDSAKDEFSYPAVIQTRDGLVHISYTWKRQRIKHVVLDPHLLPSS